MSDHWLIHERFPESFSRHGVFESCSDSKTRASAGLYAVLVTTKQMRISAHTDSHIQPLVVEAVRKVNTLAEKRRESLLCHD